jgi:ribosome hibernation promoting factor
MSPRITCRQIEIDDSIRERIIGKANKLRRFFDRIQDVDVILTQQRVQQVAEVVLHCDGLRVRAQEANEDLLTALDRVFDKVERQIKRYRKRLIDTRRRAGRRSMRATETVMTMAPTDLEDVEEIFEGSGHIIDTEQRELLTLTPEDAAMHLDLSGDSFLIFLNAENHHINVIHQRPDGHCGLIEPVVD